ncbi:MAG: hypothetical protein JKY49_16920 [Cohaesibacteraceae bacterium]|nr:hypothetical protein [Cohaesibacteraceae bacterium]
MRPLLIPVAIATMFIPGAANAQQKPPPPRKSDHPVNVSILQTPGATKIFGEVWVDNWFILHVNGKKLLQDGVSITTERSFNAEQFSFNTDRPFTFAFEFRDFVENATGLEYIGSRNQQMGDGGAIAQFHDDSSGELIAVTDNSWRCMVVQHAPVKTSCARENSPAIGSGACAQKVSDYPLGWTEPGFNDSGWSMASEHSTGSVKPKDGYNRIKWSGKSKLIRGKDLERDNIILCRFTAQ